MPTWARQCDDSVVRVAGSIAWLAFAACGNSTRALDECPGDRPTIADCYVGEFFADCGGTGDEPVLGCNDQAGCLWFTGGCAPEGYVGSTCSSDDVCCHDDWPFAGEHELHLENELERFAGLPWDRTTAATISVAVDPTLSVPTTTVMCTGTDPHAIGFNPCTTSIGGVQVVQRGTTTVEAYLTRVGVGGWSLWTEIVDDGAGTIRARVCEAIYSDSPGGYCGSYAPICAASGTVTLNQLPIADNLQTLADIDVTFANGFHVVATLVGNL